MTYTSITAIVATGSGLVGLDGLAMSRGQKLIRPLSASSGCEFAACERFAAGDDALIRHLLEHDALASSDAFRRWLAAIRSERGSPFDASIAALFDRCGEEPFAGHLLDGASRPLHRPALVGRRETAPIVLRGYAPETAPRVLAIPVACAALPEATVENVEPVLPQMVSNRGDGSTGLASALAACLTDDRAQVRAPVRRARRFGKRMIWAAAAALAVMVVVPPLAMRTRPAPATTGAVLAPAVIERADMERADMERADMERADMERAKPALANEAAAPIAPSAPLPPATAAGDSVRELSPKAPPVQTLPARTKPIQPQTVQTPVRTQSAQTQPMQAPPVKIATIEPAAVVEVESREIPTKPPAAAYVNQPSPAVSATAPVAATTSSMPAADVRSKTVVARAAKRKPRKSTAARSTTVASALSLPDVLKPQ